MKLLLCKYNNYYNRIIKKEFTYTEKNYKVIQNVNFNINDGIYTQQVINWSDNNFVPDYLLLLKDSTVIPAEVHLNANLAYVEAGGNEYSQSDLAQNGYFEASDKGLYFALARFVKDVDSNYQHPVDFDLEIDVPTSLIEITTSNPDVVLLKISGETHTVNLDFSDSNPITSDRLINAGFEPSENVYDVRPANPFVADTCPNITIIVKEQPEFPIESRWFIIDSTRNRKDQYILNLRRDIIADNYEALLDAPIYVEKAKVSKDDVAIYNDEDILFNQIKTKHIDIYDKSKCPWIVGYIERKDPGEGETNTVNLTINTPTPNATYSDMNSFYTANPEFQKGNLGMVNQFNPGIIYTDGLNGLSYALFSNLPYGKNVTVSALERSTIGNILGFKFSKTFSNAYMNANQLQSFFQMGSGAFGTTHYDPSIMLNDFSNYCKNHISVHNFTNLVNNIITSDQMNVTLAKSGLIYKIGTKYYRAKVTKGDTTFINSNIAWGSTLHNLLYGYRTDAGYLGKKVLSDPMPAFGATKLGFTVCYEVTDITASLEELPENYQQTLQLTVPNVTDRKSLDDAPYDMFFLPYGDCSENGLNPGKDFNLKVAREIAHQLGTRVFDVQILPYCPVQAWLGDKSINTSEQGAITPIKTASDSPVTLGYIYWAPTSTFTFTLQGPIIAQTSQNPLDWKIDNQCTMVRFMSPNSNSMFDFNYIKNGGSINTIKIDCTYRPANPYIHVSPDFKGLYGNDFGDKRGLICSGDFSLAKIIDKWVEYQNQNKYFQSIFDRETTHIEVVNSWELAGSITGAITGTAQGATTGAGAGFMVGGIPGAIAGGVTGGISSAAGGIADIAKTVAMQEENLNYRKDLFNLNLRTIQAQPNSISNISAFDINNKFVPFVEVYEATEQEKEAFRKKLIYNGMKVGRIGTIREFLWKDEKNYIKGQLIRMENTENDFHEINEIASELTKGVFI